MLHRHGARLYRGPRRVERGQHEAVPRPGLRRLRQPRRGRRSPGRLRRRGHPLRRLHGDDRARPRRPARHREGEAQPVGPPPRGDLGARCRARYRRDPGGPPGPRLRRPALRSRPGRRGGGRRDAPADPGAGRGGFRLHERDAAGGLGLGRQRFRHDVREPRPLPLDPGRHRAAGGRLCRAALLRGGDPGPARRSRHHGLPDHPRGRPRPGDVGGGDPFGGGPHLFRRRGDAAVLPADRPGARSGDAAAHPHLRGEPRGPAQRERHPRRPGRDLARRARRRPRFRHAHPPAAGGAGSRRRRRGAGDVRPRPEPRDGGDRRPPGAGGGAGLRRGAQRQRGADDPRHVPGGAEPPR